MPNDNALIPYRHKKVAKFYDLVWLLDNQNVELFKRWGSKCLHLPWAANRLLTENAYSYNNQVSRVLFIGAPHVSRIKQINLLLANKIPVSIYSDKVAGNSSSSEKFALHSLLSFFRNLTISTGRKIILGKMLSFFYSDNLLKNEYLEVFHSVEVDEMMCLYKRYKLSWSSVFARNTGYLKSPLITLNLRSLEIPMSGGLQFVARNDELSKYFSDGHDTVFYGEDNFIDTARHYLFGVDEKQIIEMKTNAQNNALLNHTWENRFKKIFDIMGLKQRGY